MQHNSKHDILHLYIYIFIYMHVYIYTYVCTGYYVQDHIHKLRFWGFLVVTKALSIAMLPLPGTSLLRPSTACHWSPGPSPFEASSELLGKPWFTCKPHTTSTWMIDHVHACMHHRHQNLLVQGVCPRSSRKHCQPFIEACTWSCHG